MVTVGGRREAACLLAGRKIAQRRACALAGLSRSGYRYAAVRRPDEEQLKKRLRELACEHPRFGYRRQLALLRRDGWSVNHKRVYRLWRELGLCLPRRRPSKRRLGPKGEVRKKARYSNHVWSYDFAFDGLINGRAVKILAVIDEYTRRCLCLRAGRSLTGTEVLETLEALMERHGRPDALRSDNGPEFVNRQVQAWLRERGSETIFITPGSPWENAHMESFIGKFRDECLNREWFLSLRECQVVIEQWRRHYNEVRPHSSLGYLTPAAAADSGGEAASATLRRLPLQNQTQENLTF